MEWSLRIPDFPDPKISRALSPNGRAHWTARRDARRFVQGALVGTMDDASGAVMPWVYPHRVKFTWCFPNKRNRDQDNHTTGVVKALLDGLVKLGYIVGDDSHAIQLEPTELLVREGERWLQIDIWSDEAQELDFARGGVDVRESDDGSLDTNPSGAGQVAGEEAARPAGALSYAEGGTPCREATITATGGFPV